MGYSYSQKAGFTLDYIYKLLDDGLGSSNTWKHDGNDYFFERGRENHDGAITGTVWCFQPDGVHLKRSGSVRIESDGSIARFPHIPRHVKQKANCYR